MESKISVHGREVLTMLEQNDIPCTLSDLSNEVVRCFGKDVVFHTCRHADLTLDGLLSFFIKSGKLIESKGFIAVNRGCGCEH